MNSDCMNSDDILVYLEDFDGCGWALGDSWWIVELMKSYVVAY